MRLPSTRRVDLLLGAGVGGLTALLGIALGGALLLVLGDGPVGTLRPFTELTTDGVGALTAATWTFFDLLGASPVVTWDRVLVRRGVLDVLDGSADSYAVLRVLPPVLLTVAGAVTVSLSRRLRSRGYPATDAPTTDASGTLTPGVGAYVALGFVPVALLALVLATVPVAPGASGTVEVGGTVTDATNLQGVTAGPPLLVAVLAAVGYPLLFGLLGGGLATRFGGAGSDPLTQRS